MIELDNFQFSTVFANRRKELNLTQAQIAEYVGVSRAAVSKWEKGQSYPDITLLPKLAKFFNTSIDALLGYKPQMTKEQIKQTYLQLSKKFSEKPFEEVENEIESLLKEYYACFPFVLKMAQLYINYLTKSPDREKTLTRIVQLCTQVKTHSEDLSLIREARVFEAMSYLQLGKAEEVLELLGSEIENPLDTNNLVASAYQMLGNMQKAKEIIQVSYYQNLLQLISYATISMVMELENGDYVEETITKIRQLIELYDVETLNFNTCLIFYYKAAVAYCLKGRLEEAMEMLRKYVKLCTTIPFPIKIQGNAYFYLVTDWMEQVSHIGLDAPRDEQSIKKDLVLLLLREPIFAPLKENKEFRAMLVNLACHLKVEEFLT